MCSSIGSGEVCIPCFLCTVHDGGNDVGKRTSTWHQQMAVMMCALVRLQLARFLTWSDQNVRRRFAGKSSNSRQRRRTDQEPSKCLRLPGWRGWAAGPCDCCHNPHWWWHVQLLVMWLRCDGKLCKRIGVDLCAVRGMGTVSYTHLTLPTNREV